jgi:hypothetical protein
VNAHISAVRAAFPGSMVFANGIDTNPALAKICAGTMYEDWLRPETASATTFPTDVIWRSHMQAAMDAQSAGSLTEVLMKTWTAITAQELEGWRRILVASALIADLGRICVELSENTAGPPWSFTPGPSFAVDFGAPMETSTDVRTYESVTGTQGGLYRRRFARGMAVVNTTNASLSLALDRTYVELDGTAALSPYGVPAHAGVLLRIP